jgi:hypothetical protein
MSTLTWITPAGSVGIYAENSPLTFNFEATPSVTSNKVTYTLLNGSFSTDPGSTLSLTTQYISGKWIGVLTGNSGAVNQDTVNEFTIRATETVGTGNVVVSIRDRTFALTVSGAAIPEFLTTDGLLFVVNDSTWVNYQIQFTNNSTNSSNTTIKLVSGILPPGLEINSSGLIRGYALPPVGTQQQFNFALEIDNQTGSNLNYYSIIIVNQESLPGFNGRAPALLNAQPLSFTIDPDSVNSYYYITGSSIGRYFQNDQFIFKFIGYNFNDLSENGITYTIIGLSDVVTLENVSKSETSGWYRGIIKEVGKSVQTYNLIIRVSVPGIAPGTTLTSQDVVFSMTVVGDIATEITWLTDSDLGVINNGATSELVVKATSPAEIKYRMIGRGVSTNIKTITATTTAGNTTNFLTFGDIGTWAKGAETTPPVPSTWTWDSQQPVTTVFNEIYFNNCTYLATVNPRTLIVGRNQSYNGVMYSYADGGLALRVVPSPNGAREFKEVIQSGGRVVVSGSRITTTGSTTGYSGLIAYSNSLTSLGWTSIPSSSFPSIPGNWGLNSIHDSGTRYVAVGDGGIILVSTTNNIATTSWVLSPSTTTANLQSVTWTGYRYVAVGEFGTVLTCNNPTDPDPSKWSWVVSSPQGDTLNKITVNGSTILAAGENGAIITSVETNFDQLAWTTVQNLISTSEIYDVISVADKFYLVGDVGTVLVCEYQTLVERFILSSPTITLPPNLTLIPNGDIAGRVAFETERTVSQQDQSITYTFTVQAYNTVFENINVNKTFTITVYQKYYYPYDNIYMKLMPSYKYQTAVYELCNSASLIKREYLYRPNDPNFGHQSQVIFWHTYGLPSIGDTYFYDQYVSAVQENFYWRNLTLGPIRVAEARNSKEEVIYEVVYSEIIDDLINNRGISINKEIIWPRSLIVDNSDYWTSTEKIYTDATYYDQYPIVHKVMEVVSPTEFIFDKVEALYATDKNNQWYNLYCNATGSTITSFEITLPPPATAPLMVPPSIIEVNPLTNTVTFNCAQPGLQPGDQVVFSLPADTSLTSELSRVLYPASTDNMRKQLFNFFGSLQDDSILPKWMTSKQRDGKTLGYVPAYVIAYAKPGCGELIKTDVETKWDYRLNDIQFEVDRIIVDRSMTYNYLGQPSGSSIPDWTTLPSAQPYPYPVDSKNSYVYYPHQTILPGVRRQ